MTTTTTGQNLAADYADSVAAGIADDVAKGYPFGYDEDRVNYGEEAELTAWDWLGDVLDIEYRVGSDGEYRSAKVLIGFGGPNVWVDTATCSLVVYWDTREERDLPLSFCEELDDVLAEMWAVR